MYTQWNTTSTLHAARQFHSLFGVQPASNTPTCIDLIAWHGVEVHAKQGLQTPPTFLRRHKRQFVHCVKLEAMHMGGVELECQL